MFRNLCEAYFCTPGDLENLILDQLYLMAVEKKLLGVASGTVSVSPESLYAQGIIKTRPYPGGLSYTMRMKLAAEERRLGGDSAKTKRQRRQERRERLIAAKEG